MRARTGTVEFDYTFQRSSGNQHIGERFILSAAQNNEHGHHLLTIRTDYPYQTLQLWRTGSNEPALDLWNVDVPVDRNHASTTPMAL